MKNYLQYTIHGGEYVEPFRWEIERTDDIKRFYKELTAYLRTPDYMFKFGRECDVTLHADGKREYMLKIYDDGGDTSVELCGEYVATIRTADDLQKIVVDSLPSLMVEMYDATLKRYVTPADGLPRFDTIRDDDPDGIWDD